MGTGSFLIKSSNYTKLLYGCENGDERYSLAKCNFMIRTETERLGGLEVRMSFGVLNYELRITHYELNLRSVTYGSTRNAPRWSSPRRRAPCRGR